MKKTLNKPKKNLIFWLMLIIFIFLVINICYSQKISPIFFGLSNNDKKSAIDFLQKIRSTPEFDQQLKYYENIYGPSIKDGVFAEERRREAKIKQFEQILNQNHQARDVLLRLSQLYLEKNDKISAEKYLRLANEVDPMIK